jgi:hypothetical protein
MVPILLLDLDPGSGTGFFLITDTIFFHTGSQVFIFSIQDAR